MTKKAGCILALDAGTGSGRAVLFDTRGSQVGVGQEEWTHKSDPRYPNSMDFDVISNWELLCRCIRRACRQGGISASSIMAVSATSMREGIVLYNAKGKELWACANVDARAANEVRRLKEQFPGLEEKLYRISGQTFALGALPRLLWVKNFTPEVYNETSRISMLSDWVLFRLCGEIATDPSNGGTSGIYSLAKRDWVPDMAKTVGLRDDIFPPSVETGTLIGKVTAMAAKETGLPQGLPVVMGGGDVQLGCVGLGVVKPADVAILGGTFWQQLVNLSEPTTDPKMNIRINPHAVPGLSQAEAISFFVGLTMRWFRDAFCQPEAAAAAERSKDTYDILEELARSVPLGSRGIIPIFSDIMRYGNWYHAAPSLLNLRIDPSVCGKAEIFRALEENAAIVSANNLKQISAFTGVKMNKLVFAGGASKGSLWCQILADVTGKPVRVPAVKEATALGGAIAAGIGIGLYKDMTDASAALVRWERDYEPDMGNHGMYQEIQDKWARAYAVQRSLVDEDVTQSLWKAPGL